MGWEQIVARIAWERDAARTPGQGSAEREPVRRTAGRETARMARTWRQFHKAYRRVTPLPGVQPERPAAFYAEALGAIESGRPLLQARAWSL